MKIQKNIMWLNQAGIISNPGSPYDYTAKREC